MPELPSPELKNFLDALEAFGEKPPGDLPEGALEGAKQLGRLLRGYSGDQLLSPGEREAVEKQAPGSDVPVEMAKAAVGHDQPSPGQREFADKARELAEMAGSLGPQK